MGTITLIEPLMFPCNSYFVSKVTRKGSNYVSITFTAHSRPSGPEVKVILMAWAELFRQVFLGIKGNPTIEMSGANY